MPSNSAAPRPCELCTSIERSHAAPAVPWHTSIRTFTPLLAVTKQHTIANSCTAHDMQQGGGPSTAPVASGNNLHACDSESVPDTACTTTDAPHVKLACFWQLFDQEQLRVDPCPHLRSERTRHKWLLLWLAFPQEATCPFMLSTCVPAAGSWAAQGTEWV